MKTKHTLLALCISMALAPISSRAVAAEPALYVYSTIDALLAGAYDGDLTVKELSSKGDFGLGTYNHLDGEMVVLAGVNYHVRADGSVSIADPSDKVPLAYVLPFKPTNNLDVGTELAGRPLAEMEAYIDARLPSKNLFYALQISGQFTGMTTRAIAAQVRPYRPLAEVSKTQILFKRESINGTMVGIRSPAFSKGISVPGWHWHFISDDKSYGGHVLAAGLQNGQIKFAAIRHFDVDLPKTDDFANADQAKDRAVELHAVESAQRP